MRRLLTLGLLAVAGCSASAKTPPQSIASEVMITDGDTIRWHGERIRISNIDAPELPPHSRCWAEAALSIQAANALDSLISTAKSLRLEREGRDRYGRTLARVIFNGDKDLGEALVNLGVAAKWTGRRWDWCAAPDYANDDGPWLAGGPEQNQTYTEWASKQLGHGLSRGAAPADPWSVREVAPGQGARQAR